MLQQKAPRGVMSWIRSGNLSIWNFYWGYLDRVFPPELEQIAERRDGGPIFIQLGG